MKWFGRKGNESECEMPDEESPNPRIVEARHEREISEHRLLQVLPLAATLREMRSRNHISELIDELIEKRAGGSSS